MPHKEESKVLANSLLMSQVTSPFARVGLFRNPFGELTVAERAELAVVDIDEHLDWLGGDPIRTVKSRDVALQFVGPCGHGKSTHLRALQYAWARRYPIPTAASHYSVELPAYVYYPEQGDQPPLPRSRPLFIDEVQRMRWWRRRQMLTGQGPLILGTHCDLSEKLTAAGFRVRTVDLACGMSPERLQELLNRRMVASAINPAVVVNDSKSPWDPTAVLAQSPLASLALSLDQVVVLQQRFGSNIRSIEGHLYFHFQNFVLKGKPWLPVA